MKREILLEKIKKEYENYKNIVEESLSLEEQKELGAFYTPPELSLLMVEKLGPIGKMIDNDFLDPCCGAGGLLAAAILAGIANPNKCYGIEINSKMADICRKRLKLLGVPEKNIRIGDALNEDDVKNFRNDIYWELKN